MSIYEYDAEKHIRQEKQESYAEGMEEGEAKGAVSMLYTLAAEGLISLDAAAEKAGMSVSFFRDKMNEYIAESINDEK